MARSRLKALRFPSSVVADVTHPDRACTCGSTATGRVSGRTPRSAATWRDAGPLLTRLHVAHPGPTAPPGTRPRPPAWPGPRTAWRSAIVTLSAQEELKKIPGPTWMVTRS